MNWCCAERACRAARRWSAAVGRLRRGPKSARHGRSRCWHGCGARWARGRASRDRARTEAGHPWGNSARSARGRLTGVRGDVGRRLRSGLRDVGFECFFLGLLRHDDDADAAIDRTLRVGAVKENGGGEAHDARDLLIRQAGAHERAACRIGSVGGQLPVRIAALAGIRAYVRVACDADTVWDRSQIRGELVQDDLRVIAQADVMPTWNPGDEFEAARKKALAASGP